MFTQMVANVFNAQVNSGNVRQLVYPVGAATLAASDNAAGAWAWSAYVQIVAAAAIADPCWLVGVHMNTPTVEAFQADLAIASGALAAEVDLAMVCITSELFAVVEGKSVVVPVHPIRIAGTPRLAVRIRKSTAASLAGVSIKVICLTGLGT